MEYHSTNDYIIKFRDGESDLQKQKRMKKISRYKKERERKESFSNERTKKLGKEFKTGCSTTIHSPMLPAFTDKKYRAETQVKKYNVIQMSKVQLY